MPFAPQTGMQAERLESASRLRELTGLFLRLGFTAFGGPAAHVALMREEVVRRRGWLSDESFLDLLGATNLIPGPNSTEMAIHIGYLRAGWSGLVASGLAFILPAASMVLGLAWAYERFGATPAAEWLLYGVKPVVIGLILNALWALGKKAITGALTAAVGALALGLFALGWNEIGLLFGAGLVVMLAVNLRRLRLGPISMPSVFPWLSLPPAIVSGIAAGYSLPLLFLTFLKIGSVLFGSGYVLVAFLRADFVTRLGWLTDRQLLDAIAVGQVTPGPLFTTATFLGYLLGGVPGAAVATLGIFLPSFFFVALSNPWIPQLRRSPWFGSLLDGVNVGSLALMAGVTVQLGRASIVDVPTAILTVLSTAAIQRQWASPTQVIVAGAVFGAALHILRW
jgi:chromate transporter